jgi:transcriptional regulator GlxA family with amidase domain
LVRSDILERSIMATMRSARNIVFVLFEGFDLLDVAGPVEVFATACGHGRGGDYRVHLCAERVGRVRSDSGVALYADATLARAPANIHTLVVPGCGAMEAVLADPRLIASIRRLAARSQRVVSVCTGSFLLAAAGLLVGRRATTHWRYAEDMARRFPDVQLQPDAIYVQDGNCWTAAGVTAGMDLSLALVEADHGQTVALDVARALVFYLKRPGGQSQFSVPLRAQTAEHSLIERARRAIIDQPGKHWSVQRLAEQVHVSERHLRRLFGEELGISPRAFIQGAMLELAQRLLSDGDAQVAEVARRCGYDSAAAFSRRFESRLGISPVAYRARFQVRASAMGA